MESPTELRRSTRSKRPVQRLEPAEAAQQPSDSQRPSPLKKANARKKKLETGSVKKDVMAASIPVSFYEEIEAKFPDAFCAEEDDSVPYYEATMEDLVDPEKLIKHAVAMAREKDTAFTKVRMPQEWIQKLRRQKLYPYFYPLMLNAVREKIRMFDEDGDARAYVRETEFYDTYLPREFTFPEEIYKVPQKIRPKKLLSTPFDPALASWLDCEKNFWDDIPKTHNHDVLYAPEVDGSLFPKIFTPFCMNGLIGFLKDAMKSQGHIPGIFTNVVYFGQARSCFPWHTEDFELLSANYHHLGAPKVWYGLAPKQRKLSYATFANHYDLYFDHCPQEPRHKRLFTAPAVLEEAGIRVVKTVQRAGDLIVTAPWGYHCGFSLGLCVTEAVNAGYEDINKALIEKVHEKEMFCQCGYVITGVILDYQIFGVNGHINSIKKIHEENANMRLRITELERLVRGSAPPRTNDGLVPSTSSATATYDQFQADHGFDAHDSGFNDYASASLSPTRGSPVRNSRINRRRPHVFDSDDEDEDDRSPPVRRRVSAAVSDDSSTDNDDDGRVPSAAPKASTTAKRGWNPYTQREHDAIIDYMVSDGIYDPVMQSFVGTYLDLPVRKRPTSNAYWKGRAQTGDLKNRNTDSCRTYVRKKFEIPV